MKKLLIFVIIVGLGIVGFYTTSYISKKKSDDSLYQAIWVYKTLANAQMNAFQNELEKQLNVEVKIWTYSPNDPAANLSYEALSAVQSLVPENRKALAATYFNYSGSFSAPMGGTTPLDASDTAVIEKFTPLCKARGKHLASRAPKQWLTKMKILQTQYGITPKIIQK